MSIINKFSEMAIVNIFSALSLVILLANILPIPADSLFGSDCGKNKSHNFQFGTKGIFDKLLYSDKVTKDATFLRKVTVDVQYPTVQQIPLGYITYMEVLDQFDDGTGGCAFLLSGGVGQDTVKFHLKSQRGGPIAFKINIYGLDNVCIKHQ